MKKFLTLPEEDRRLAFDQAASALGIPALSVEKDFWVCWTLETLFNLPDIGPRLTFKGGTSLSKVWGLIQRFSEDIDLTLDRDTLGFGGDSSPEAAPSTTQRKKRSEQLALAGRTFVREQILPALQAAIAARLGTQGGWTLVLDDTDREEPLLFHYPAVLTPTPAGYIAPMVKIEFGARSDVEPAVTADIESFVQARFPQLFATRPLPVRVLTAERTFWEKAMLLHEEAMRGSERPVRPRMARHYYDIYCLIEHGIATRALADSALFERVRQTREVYFPVTGVDYSKLRSGTLQLQPPAERIDAWRQDYEQMRRDMFIGDPPDFDTVLRVVGCFEATFNRQEG